MFACEICDRQFFYKNSVNRHFRREHINKESRRRLKCTECEHECRFYQDLRTHIYVEHGIVCKVERQMFSDLDEFNAWKRKLEETTHFMYVKHSSSKISATTNERKTYYVCHRTGTFQSGSCGKRKLKRQGSNKINASCPSTMEVVESLNDGTVNLVLWKTHVGHDAEVSRTFLSTSERNWLSARIMEGASYQKIMNEIQNLGNKGGRMRFIKSQDIRNMRKNLTNSRNRNILSDLRYWVKTVLSLESTDTHPIVCFKDRNVPDTQKILSSKDVLLVIMTKFQLEALKLFGCGMICLDATHYQDNYEYHLITMYVADTSMSWCPVAYLVTNVMSLTSMQYFFTRIRELAGQLKCSVFLSDDGLPFYEAWRQVMTLPKHRLLHLWYIDKSWKENILKMKCPDSTKTTVVRGLKMMLNDTTEKSFEINLKTFVESLQCESRYTEFLDYFQTEFADKTKLWGGCYRKTCGLTLESELFLESTHKRLEKEYHDGVHNQKLAENLTNLVSISHECSFISKRIAEYCKNGDAFRSQCIQQSHKRGVCIKRTEVVEESPTEYKIMYTNDRSKTDWYIVKYSNISRCGCSAVCDTCKICCHEYTCTCVDYVVNINICEHIHACAIIKNKINVDLSAETDAPLDSFVEEVICEEEIICNVDAEDNGCDDDMIDGIDDNDSNDNDIDIDIVENNSTLKDEMDDQLELSSETSENVCLNDSPAALYYEPFTFVPTDEIVDYNQTELQFTQEGLQIVAFKEDDEYEAVLVNDDDTSSFGDSSSVYEDTVPQKTAIIALGFGSEGSDSYIFRRFDENTIIRHKVDTLFTLADFDNGDENDITAQLDTDISAINETDFANCYGTYDPNDDDSIVLSL
ncbi:uncharacterized protein LOC135835914 [Planococcus citri]|uniref:uncharacterized protein LOC135835914 n=1 Tax=Planococcus citri TaxID=170843 RepID=UPI0031F80CC2